VYLLGFAVQCPDPLTGATSSRMDELSHDGERLLLATSATIGAAPVPVPPPIPAVIKTRSAFSKVVAISSRDSSAADR